MKYLQLGVLQQVPAGMVADKAADFGLIALMSNANVYAALYTTVATAGTNSNLTAVQALSGLLRMTTGASGGFTITLPATSVLISAGGPTIPTDGTFSKVCRFLNDNVGQTGTLTVGDASTTITGTASIATDTRRDFIMTITSPTTITFQNIGSAAI